MQYLSPTWKGGIFVNVDFDVLGQGLGLTPHSGTRDPQHVWRSKYCNKFFTSLCYSSGLRLTLIFDIHVYALFLKVLYQLEILSEY